MDGRHTWTQKKTLDKLNNLTPIERYKKHTTLKRKNTKIKSTDTIEEKKEKCKYNIEYYKAVLESLESNTIQQLTTNESNGSNPNADICGNSNSGSEEETE